MIERGARLLEGDVESLAAHASVARMLVDAVVDELVYLLDPLGRILSWSAVAERATGYAGEEVIGRSVAMLYRPEDVERGVPEHELATAARLGFIEANGPRVGREGQPVHAQITMRALRDRAGALAGFARIANAVTGGEAAASEIESLVRVIGHGDSQLQSQDGTGPEPNDRARPMLSLPLATEALHVALMSVNEHYVALDREQRVAAVSPSLAAILGGPVAALVGRPVRDVFASSAGAAFLRDLPDRLGHRRTAQYVASDTSDTSGREWWIVASGRAAGWAVILYRQ